MGYFGLSKPAYSSMKKKWNHLLPMGELLDHCSLFLLYLDSETSTGSLRIHLPGEYLAYVYYNFESAFNFLSFWVFLYQ